MDTQQKMQNKLDDSNLDSESEDLSQSERELVTIDGDTSRIQAAEDASSNSLLKLLNYSS